MRQMLEIVGEGTLKVSNIFGIATHLAISTRNIYLSLMRKCLSNPAESLLLRRLEIFAVL